MLQDFRLLSRVRLVNAWLRFGMGRGRTTRAANLACPIDSEVTYIDSHRGVGDHVSAHMSRFIVYLCTDSRVQLASSFLPLTARAKQSRRSISAFFALGPDVRTWWR